MSPPPEDAWSTRTRCRTTPAISTRSTNPHGQRDHSASSVRTPSSNHSNMRMLNPTSLADRPQPPVTSIHFYRLIDGEYQKSL